MTQTGYSYNKLVSIDDYNCFAKEEDGKFFVKQAQYGPSRPHLFNKNSLSYNDGDELRFDRSSDKKMFDFIEVSEDVFALYIKYLKTGNESYLRNAERILLWTLKRKL